MYNKRNIYPFWHFLLIVLLLLFSSSSQANNSKNNKQDIKGVVIDKETGEALPYANVVLKDTRQGATTNTDGYFVILNAPAEICTLQVHYIGYATQTIILDNTNESSESLQIKMDPRAIEDKGITVVAEEYQIWKTADEVAKVTFSPRELTSLPNLGQADIFRSLQLLPGISGANDGTAGLNIRGGTPDQNLVLLDGMTVYHVDHFFGLFSAFNADAIKDVQLYKGGFPAKYGGRLSSVVELTGKSGDTNKKHFSAGVNLISANGLFELPLFNNKGSFIITARRSYTDLIQSSLYNKLFDFMTDEQATQTIIPSGNRNRGVQQQEVRPDFYFYDLNSKLSYAPTDGDILALSFYTGRDKMHDYQEMQNMGWAGDEGESLQEITGNRGRDETTDWGNWGVSFRWSHRWQDRFNSTFHVANSNYFSKYESDLSFTTDDTASVFRGGRTFASQEDNEIKDITFRMDNEWYLSKEHTIEFGTWISQTQTDYVANLNDTVSVLDQTDRSLQSSIFVQDKLNFNKKWILTYGIRGTYYDLTDQFYFEPRFSAQYNLWDVVNLKGAWGRYHQFIHRIENEDILEGSRDFWLVADQNLTPSFSEHKILGMTFETTQYILGVEGYYKDLDNILEFSRRFQERADFGGLFFFGSGISQGVEFFAQNKSGPFNGWVSYTLSEVEYEFPNLNNGDSFPASHDRTHEIKLVGNYSTGRWNFSANWIYATGQPYTTPVGQYTLDLLGENTQSYYFVGDKNAFRLPDYHRMDISASYHFKFNDRKSKGEIGLSIFNVYDQTNLWYRKYDLEVSPILITDVTMLGFTPTLYLKVDF